MNFISRRFYLSKFERINDEEKNKKNTTYPSNAI